MSTYIANRASVLGKPIEEATENRTINLTERQIKASKRGANNACALVRACEESVNNVEAAFFFRTVAYLEFKTKFVRYQLPPATQREIVVYDRGGNMAAGKYLLRAPSKAETRAGKREYKTTHKETGKGPKRKIVHVPGIRDATDPSIRVGKKMGAIK